jgi:hypothetical protein
LLFLSVLADVDDLLLVRYTEFLKRDTGLFATPRESGSPQSAAPFTKTTHLETVRGTLVERLVSTIAYLPS